MELNSHVYEATTAIQPDREVDVLVDILQKLGDPEDVLQPLVAYKKSQQAGYSFNPMHILQALYLNVSRGIGHLILALGYIVIISFGSLTVFKLISPSHTGLFFKNGHWFAFGYISRLPGGLTESLGDWFIVVVLIIAAIFYFLNTYLLRFMKKE